ncbi:MAG: class C sortase [Oscillospiraceae bacterium]|nr:class C sortase [Oscillospiraceae bacterium]
MKRYIINIILIVTMLIGIGLLLYPSISNYLNSKVQTKVISTYTDATKDLSENENQALIDAAHEYNQRLASTSGAFYDPSSVSGYDSTLNAAGTGVMGYLTIEKIGVELPVYHGVDDDVLQIAVGHLPGTSLPVGGETTHAVMSGHRGLPGARLFTDLDKMEIGDTFYITVLKDVYTYQVDQIKTVTPFEVDDLQLERGKDYCTLFTCTPYGINTHRMLVRGVRIETIEKKKIYIKNEAFRISPYIVTPLVATPMLVVLLIYVMFSGRKTVRTHRDSKRLKKQQEKKNA